MAELRPIAVLRTPFAEKFGVPRQSGLVPTAEGRVEFVPEFAAAESAAPAPARSPSARRRFIRKRSRTR